MSKDNNATLCASRVEKLKDKVTAGEKRVDLTSTAVSQLIVEEAPEHKIVGAKRDAEAAMLDLGHLTSALATTQAALVNAEAAEKVEGVKTRAGRIKKLQARRAKSLEKAEAAFKLFIDKIVVSERLAIQLHQASGGCRTVGDALNQRHGPMGAWMVTRFVEVLPGAEQGISQTIANHVHARQQFEGKSLSDTQGNYAEMFQIFHAPKDEAA